jgi:predicted oxidoreductase
MSTVGHRAICIFDSDYPTNVFKLQPKGEGLGDMSRIPITKDSPLVKNILVSNDWQAEVQQAIERGAIKKADTLEELADKLNLGHDIVVGAVKRWNETCAKRADDELAIPYLPEWLIPIKKAPFFAAIMSGQVGKTLCGLRTDEYLQVMKPDGTLVPGLYANYSTAGGFVGEGIYSSQFNGALFGSVATSFISGYHAAKSLLAANV